MELKHGVEKTEKLVPYANNAKIHNAAQVKEIADSITTFGFNDPVQIGPDNMIIAGHGRVLAAQLLGMPEVPVIYLNHLSERERRAYILAHNKIAENASYDQSKIAQEMDYLLANDFDLQFTGYDEQEIDDILKEADALGEPLFEDASPFDIPPSKPEKKPRIGIKKEASKIVHTCPNCDHKFQSA